MKNFSPSGILPTDVDSIASLVNGKNGKADKTIVETALRQMAGRTSFSWTEVNKIQSIMSGEREVFRGIRKAKLPYKANPANLHELIPNLFPVSLKPCGGDNLKFSHGKTIGKGSSPAYSEIIGVGRVKQKLIAWFNSAMEVYPMKAFNECTLAIMVSVLYATAVEQI